MPWSEVSVMDLRLEFVMLRNNLDTPLQSAAHAGMEAAWRCDRTIRAGADARSPAG